MFYATQDSDGIYIREDAEIRAFATLEAAKNWLLSCYDESHFDYSTALFECGEYDDCWTKLHSHPTDAVDGFELDELIVSAPGSHPGGRRWWITPRADVLVVTAISARDDEDDGTIEQAEAA